MSGGRCGVLPDAQPDALKRQEFYRERARMAIYCCSPDLRSENQRDRSPPHQRCGGPHVATLVAWPRSERLDRNLAELDHAGAVLQREVPFLEHAVADVDGLLAVEHHNEMPSVGSDLKCVPLAGGFGHWVHLGEVDDRTRAVARVRPIVLDVQFVAVP